MTDDVEPGSDEALARIHDSWRRRLEAWRERTGTGEVEVREQRLGRQVVRDVLVGGSEKRSARLPIGLVQDLGRWWQDRTGEVPYEIWQRLPAEGSFPAPHRVVCDRPPSAEKLRTTGAAFTELRVRPRPAAQVPGWIKVELALVGAWDLRADRLTTNRLGEPVGEPQTPASVGVAPPPGAEHAWSPQWRDAMPPPTDWERGEPDLEAWPSGAAPLPVWSVALPVARWHALRVDGVVEVLPPVRERLEPDHVVGHAGLPPALHEVAATFGGISVGAWTVRWVAEMAQYSWKLGDRLTYVPLDDSAEPLALRIDPGTGALADVVLVQRLEDEPRVVAPDLPTFLEGLTWLAERRLLDLVRDARDDVVADALDGRLDVERDTPVVAETVGDAFGDLVWQAASSGDWPGASGAGVMREHERRVAVLVRRSVEAFTEGTPGTVSLLVRSDGSVQVVTTTGRGLRRRRQVGEVPPYDAFHIVALQQLATLQGRPWSRLDATTDASGEIRLEPGST